VSRARELLGWQPRVDLEAGLRIVADSSLDRVA
jgi:nucleoside-diphosphate-sugar epimerase